MKQILVLLLHMNIIFLNFGDCFPSEVSLRSVEVFAEKQKLMSLSQEVCLS